MFVEKTHSISIIEILEGQKQDILKNIELLASDYFDKTGRQVCRSCPSDINYMILSLKNIYRMTQFKFKRHAAQYKNAKGDKTTISNGNLTDEKAIEFLRTNPARISLFAVYPSNWETILIDGAKKETPKQLKARLAAEAELQAANEAAAEKEAKDKAAAAAGTSENSPGPAAGTSSNLPGEAGTETEGNLDETEEEKEARLAAEAAEKEAAKAAAAAEAEAAAAAGEAAAAALAAGTTGTSSEKVLDVEVLSRMSLKELRAKYPEIKATSIKDFIDKLKA